MFKKRKFVRVRCRVKSSLELKGHIVHGHLENVSVSGALLRLHESMLARPGDLCRLSIYPSDEKAPLRVRAELIHVGFSLAGLRFTEMDEQTKLSLLALLHTIGSDLDMPHQQIGTPAAEEMGY